MSEQKLNMPRPSNSAAEKERLFWPDGLKAVALCWIFLNHVVERIFGYPFVANPDANWPPFDQRLEQLKFLTGSGIWDVPVNVVRYLGWFGDQGVQLFLIASGFGLTWSLLRKNDGGSLPILEFYRRRLVRVYPLWWVAHVFFLILFVLLDRSQGDLVGTLLSFLGIRVLPGHLYSIVPAWWYIGLLIQLYLVFPILWKLLQRLGGFRFFVWTSMVAMLIRGSGLMVFTDYLDAWSRGAIFITRLPEFVFGMSLAFWLNKSKEKTETRLASNPVILFAAAIYAAGTGLSLTLAGMTVAPAMLGIGAFVILYGFLRRKQHSTIMRWLGEHSYSLFLTHHLFIILFIPVGIELSTMRMLAAVSGAIVLTVVSALLLEKVVDGGVLRLNKWKETSGLSGVVKRLAAIEVGVVAVFATAEAIIRFYDPQEVFGWGERPSLQGSSEFGWNLKPSQTHQLRWESYDYTMTSNSLGFPGPEYAVQRNNRTYRIMTTGDAFTSAEGVNIEESWPRILERKMNSAPRNRTIEVLNFAITGYGPNQYAAVIDSFLPVYKPDLVIVEFFVNDFLDVLTSTEEFRRGIGFELPDKDSWKAWVRLSHLMKFIRLRILNPLADALGRTNPHGYFLGNIVMLEKEGSVYVDSKPAIADRLTEMKGVVVSSGADLLAVMVPSSVQAVSAKELSYFPRNVNLKDTTRFDVDLPQRMMKDLCDSLGIKFVDLREAFRLNPKPQTYHPNNMHWTRGGHEVAAEYLVTIIEGNLLKTQEAEFVRKP